MEEYKNTQQTPISQPQPPHPVAQNPLVQQPVVTQPPVTPTPPNKKSPLLLLILLGLIIVFAIAAFFVISKPKNQALQTTTELLAPTTPQTIPTVVEPTAIPSPASLEEQEVDKVTIDENIDADFESVDKDVNQL